MTHTNANRSYGLTWYDNNTILCLISGLLLGTLVSCRMLIHGDNTDISGFFRGIIIVEKRGKPFFDIQRLSSICYVGGMIVSQQMPAVKYLLIVLKIGCWRHL